MKNRIAPALLCVSIVAEVACAPRHRLWDGGIERGTLPASDSGRAEGDAGVDAGVDAGIAPRVLFIGNSFTSVNDVPGHFQALLSGLAPGVSVEAVTPGGYTWAQDWQDAQTDGTALARWLRTGAPVERAFNAVVLQEQSQIGGFPIEFPDRAASVAAASGLAGLAHRDGASVALYLTWGYEHGDPTNAAIDYDTFVGMQDRLDDGYLGLAASLAEGGGDVRLAPVGGGFRVVFEDPAAAGQDPTAAGSDFDALYEADGIHPSVQGAYLAACMFAGTISSADVRRLPDEPTLGAQVSSRLRDVCARALADPRWNLYRVDRPGAVLNPDPPAPCDGGDWECIHVDPQFGGSLALSADATRALIQGEIFVRTDAGWLEESLLSSVDKYGEALSENGTRALAAASSSADVYARSGTTWVEDQALAIDGGPGCVPNAQVPFILTADGNRAAVGGATCFGTNGAEVMPRVLVRTVSGWVDEAPLPAKQIIALDGTGVRALVSADDGGVARVFARTGSSWNEEATLVSNAPELSGTALMVLSADGTRAFGGAVPAVMAMFERNGSGWAEQSVIRDPSRTFGLPASGFSASVALSADGRRAAVSMPDDSPVVTGCASGSVKVYDLDDRGYHQQFLLVPRDAGGGEAFGASVAISGDGHTVVVGAPNADSYRGAVYAFSLP